MTIILPPEPQEEAKLIALAQEKGVTTDALVRAAINAMLADAGNAAVPEPIHSLRGLLAKYGPAPSARWDSPKSGGDVCRFPAVRFVMLAAIADPD